MTRASRTGLLAVIGVVVMLAPGVVSAAPILYSSATTFAQNQDAIGQPSDYETTGILNNVDTTPLVDASAGLASSYASVTDGVLSAYAEASSLITGINGQVAWAQVIFVDTLTLFSNTLATGTLVTLSFGLDLDATSTQATANGVQLACGESNAGLAVYVVGGTQTVASAKETSCVGSTDSNTGTTLTYAIGDSITVQALLYVNAYGRAGFGSYADAAHTLRLLINPLGDFSYTTLSGNTYVSEVTPAPVPEPMSLLLLGCGIAGVAARVRRRSQQQAS